MTYFFIHHLLSLWFIFGASAETGSPSVSQMSLFVDSVSHTDPVSASAHLTQEPL